MRDVTAKIIKRSKHACIIHAQWPDHADRTNRSAIAADRLENERGIVNYLYRAFLADHHIDILAVDLGDQIENIILALKGTQQLAKVLCIGKFGVLQELSSPLTLSSPLSSSLNIS